MKSDIVQIVFDIKVPENKWLAKLNKLYSQLSFNILSKYLLEENIGNTLFEIKGHSLKKFITEFKSIVSSSAFQILHQGEQFLILNVKIKDPWILNALVKTELILLYPLNIIDGMIKVTAIAQREKVDLFLKELEEKKIRFRINKIGGYQHESLLSQRQKKLLEKLYKNGYYDIPRGKSLTELAKSLNISPSALSESIRRIHRKIAENQLF